MPKTKWIMGAAVALLLSLSLVGPSSAAPKGGVNPAAFYKGSIVDFTCPAAPGGSVDFVARAWVRFLKGELGARAVPLSNRRAGGGLEGYMYLWNAKPNGLALGVALRKSMTVNNILKEPGAQYRAENYSFLYAIGNSPTVAMVAPGVTLDRLKAGKGLKFASGTSGSTGYIAATFIDALGLDAKVVLGFRSSSEARLSVQQGESAGMTYSINTALEGMAQKQVQPLCIIGSKRSPALPGVPALTELVTLTGEQRFRVETIWGKWQTESRMLLGPPGIPKDRLDYLRKIAKSIAERKDFRSMINSSTGYEETDYMTGLEIENEVKDLMKEQERVRRSLEQLEKYFM